ncbi:MAG: ATP-binding cassette domain-containing protein [Planctomycetes bacterium]|nr:ATP-binding cassette domain-containing protein [Planctomycetota bacterium]MBI3848011.1 ATP-binding cassette domain-containing protein [Planctomycetota bacterium]
MIRVRDLTKRFAGVTAIDRLTFEVGAGEIVGFLGPNGAGKSTTLRILTGFIPATEGSAEIGGKDVVRQSRDVRRLIGYLPESNPLYGEMRVEEYLLFRAALKRVATRARRRARVAEVVERCGLGDVRTRIVGQLSKGYRQRVGIADALVHDPPLLVLDEPTVGLDPRQIREVRDLIRSLGESHTILLSTHILPEVDMICSRVLLIDRGRIALDEPLARLRAVDRVVVELLAPPDTARAAFADLPGVIGVVGTNGTGVSSTVTLSISGNAEAVLDAVYRRATERGLPLRELRREKQSLEEIFVRVTTHETARGVS